MTDGAESSQVAVREDHDPQTVADQQGTLATLNLAGVLDAADVHITRRLARLVGAPVDDTALIGAALAVRAVRLGSTCLALNRVVELAVDDPQLAAVLPTAADLERALATSPLVQGNSRDPLRPLMLAQSDDGPLLYLRKYFRQEQLIRTVLDQRTAQRPVVDGADLDAAVDAVFGSPHLSAEPDLQRTAAQLAAVSRVLVVAGGPGTGKTYTVARILEVLDRLSGHGARIGLCAPTGRAAAQLQAEIAAHPGAPANVRAVTVHSLLRWRPGQTPRYGRGNKLPFDVVVVDETSMLSLTAMSKLLDAVRADCRVILVGDPHQLASVEAGAVLADLVERTGPDPSPEIPSGVVDPRLLADVAEHARLRRGVVTLRRGHRFGSGIEKVAAAINRGDADQVVAMVTDPAMTEVTLVDPDDLDGVRADVVDWATSMRRAALSGEAGPTLTALDTHRVLCAHREGRWGVRGWERRVVEWLADLPGHRHVSFDGSSHYAGQPLLVTATDPQNGVFNGDSGVVVRVGPGADDDPGVLRVVFRRGDDVASVHPTQLADVIPLYAMTIHRSQGSQFDGVTVVVPPEGSELLTRELLYTAVTRARRQVRIVGNPEVLAAAVHRRVARASGLRHPIRVDGLTDPPRPEPDPAG